MRLKNSEKFGFKNFSSKIFVKKAKQILVVGENIEK